MKTALVLGGAAIALLAGCASDHHRHYSRYEYRDRPDVVVEHRDGDRTYVREYDRNYRGYEYNNLQPQYRGKHPDAMGWNDPYSNRDTYWNRY